MFTCLRHTFRPFFFFFFLLGHSVFSWADPVQLYAEQGLFNHPENSFAVNIYTLDACGERQEDFDFTRKVKVEDISLEASKDTGILFDQSVIFQDGLAGIILDSVGTSEMNIRILVEGFSAPFDVHLKPLEARSIVAGPEENPPEPEKTVPAKELTIKSLELEESRVIILHFSEALNDESAIQPDHYKAITNKKTVYPLRVEFGKDFVVLTFSETFDDEEEGYVEVRNVRDIYGNEIESDTRSPDFKGSDCGCQD